MPYIKQENRKKYDSLIETLTYTLRKEGEVKAGDLNYVITKLILDSHKTQKLNYDQFNKIMGVLNCATLEFYRRQISPYEDLKINENGDV